MRNTILFSLAILLSTPVLAQSSDDKPVETWYYVSNDRSTEAFQAVELITITMDNKTEIFGDGESLGDMLGSVEVDFAGTGSEANAVVTGSSGTSQEVDISEDGNTITITTTTTSSNGRSKRTDTTTTTIEVDGENGPTTTTTTTTTTTS